MTPSLRDAIDVGRAIAHHAAAVVADVPDTDVVAPEDEDVRFLRGGHGFSCWKRVVRSKVGNIPCRAQRRHPESNRPRRTRIAPLPYGCHSRLSRGGLCPTVAAREGGAEAARRRLERLLDEHGLLLVHDAKLPSATACIAGAHYRIVVGPREREADLRDAGAGGRRRSPGPNWCWEKTRSCIGGSGRRWSRPPRRGRRGKPAASRRTPRGSWPGSGAAARFARTNRPAGKGRKLGVVATELERRLLAHGTSRAHRVGPPRAFPGNVGGVGQGARHRRARAPRREPRRSPRCRRPSSPGRRAGSPRGYYPGTTEVDPDPCSRGPGRLSSAPNLERWPRGRRRRFAKPLYGPKAVSRVRIPPSPQVLPAGTAALLTSGRGHGIRVPHFSRAAVAHLDRAPAYEAGGRKFESFQPRKFRH